MGCGHSCSCSPSPSLKSVRIVHLNGYVEDFEPPITVGQVTGKPPAKHLVCAPAQLLTSAPKSLKADVVLQPGHFYFLLPFSSLQADVSPLILASLAKRLTAAAQSTPFDANSLKRPSKWSPSLGTIKENQTC